MKIDTLKQIAQMPIFPLKCVDCLQGKGLRYVFCTILHNIYNVFPQVCRFDSQNPYWVRAARRTPYRLG